MIKILKNVLECSAETTVSVVDEHVSKLCRYLVGGGLWQVELTFIHIFRYPK